MQTGILLPRTTNLTITGAGGCEFDSTTTVTISGNVTVQSVKVDSANKLTVTIQTGRYPVGGKGAKTVTVSPVLNGDRNIHSERSVLLIDKENVPWGQDDPGE